jgi:DNA-binding response OmpR family regulator
MNFKITQQAEKLEEIDSAKSRFFANISHDLRSPLSLILGNFEAVINSKESYLTDQAKKQLDTAHKNAERLLFLTDEINELTTLENGAIKLNKKLVPVVPFLTSLLQIFSTSAKYKNISLQFNSVLEDDICIDMDPNQFEKIIFNLISNAFKHTQEGDEIQVTADLIEGQTLSIKITDSGEGIEPKHLPYLFDRYYQSPTNKYHVYEGLGIGLALVKELVDIHDGSIAVTSTLGKGASFNMTFPFLVISTSNTTIPEQSESLIRKNELWRDLWEKTYQPDPKVEIDLEKHEKQETILLVDDHPEVREFIAGLISSQYHIQEAENGLKALEVLDTHYIDLVITDLMMPWMDGFELLEKMKSDEKLSSIPVLVVSARNSADDQFEVLKKGINNIIQKPFSHEEILLKIKNLLLQKKNWSRDHSNSIIVDDKPLINDIEQEILEKVKQLVLDQIDNPELTVLVLADAMAASERKVYRMIKKLTNMTPHEYIKEIRWLYVEQLIKNKNLKNASEAARSVGMKNVTNFKKQFHSRFNRSLDEMIEKQA